MTKFEIKKALRKVVRDLEELGADVSSVIAEKEDTDEELVYYSDSIQYSISEILDALEGD